MKKHFVTMTISFICIILGIIITVYEGMNFTIMDDFTDSGIHTKTISYDVKVEPGIIEIHSTFTKEPTIAFDNDLSANDVKIDITYYDRFMNISNSNYSSSDNNAIFINAYSKDSYETIKKYVLLTFDGLKKDILYNYEQALRPDIKITINEINKDDIKIID